jgi:hypothetical protein
MKQMLAKIRELKKESAITFAVFMVLYAANAYAIGPILQDAADSGTAMLATAGIFLVAPLIAGAWGGYAIAKKDAGNISLLLPGAVIAIGFLLAGIPALIMSGLMSESEFKERWDNNVRSLSNETRAFLEKSGTLEYDPGYKDMAVYGIFFSLLMDLPILFALGAAGAWIGRRTSRGG